MNRITVPNDNHLRLLTRISEYELKHGLDEGRYVIDEVLRQQRESAARLIVSKGSKTTHQPYYTDVTLDLYVFSPDEFYEVVNKEAMRIAQQMRF